MLQQEGPGDYVLATGRQYAVREFCVAVFERVGIGLRWEGEGVGEVGVETGGTGRVLVRVTAKYFRPAEVDSLLGDPSHAEKTLGWKRNFDFYGLVDDMVSSEIAIEKSGQDCWS